jgi:hypothetical protein
MINPMDKPIKVKKTLKARTLSGKSQGFCQIHNRSSSVRAIATLQEFSIVVTESFCEAFANVVEEMQVLIGCDKG